MSLSDLSKELPTAEDIENYTTYVVKENDRGSAVMAASLVERALEDAIRSRLVKPEDGTADTWFSGINAPFKSFSAKITLGRAIGIYGPNMEGRLKLIKDIRNAFAHRMIPLDFTHPTLIAECRKLSYVPLVNGTVEARVAYASMCLVLSKNLRQYAQRHAAIEIKAELL